MICNRDELVSRPLAVPPRWTTAGARRVSHPVDPLGGGTWIAVNERGVAIALLNRQTRPDASEPCSARLLEKSVRRSRGEIPVALSSVEGLPDAYARLAHVPPATYAGFLVLVVASGELLVAASDGVRLTIQTRPLDVPVAFTSSSLGDGAAERLRLPLFDALVASGRDPWSGQRAFHNHHWADRPELSVRMRRRDAYTVSRTQVDVTGGDVALDYEPLAPVP